MTKAELRKQATIRRKSLSDAEVASLSQQLLDQFASFELSQVNTIHIFLPIAEKKEPDTFLFVDWLVSNHPKIKIIVPRADFDTSLMSNYIYEGKESLIKNFYNILEPAKGVLHTGEVDIVMVPMLAFDKKGYRVGYGKGFYDRFLQNVQTQKVGLSLFGPIDDIADVNNYDVKLDFCITPNKIYRF